MKTATIFLFAILLSACTPASREQVSAPSPSPTANPSRETRFDLEAGGDGELVEVTTKPRLDDNELKRLREALPDQVREVLEKSTRFEVIAKIKDGKPPDDRLVDQRQLVPNRIYKLGTSGQKIALLNAFYEDVGRAGDPSVCFTPHHGFRAYYQDKVVEIRVCYSCVGFVGKMGDMTFRGGIARDGRVSEKMLNDIVVYLSEPIEKVKK